MFVVLRVTCLSLAVAAHHVLSFSQSARTRYTVPSFWISCSIFSETWPTSPVRAVTTEDGRFGEHLADAKCTIGSGCSSVQFAARRLAPSAGYVSPSCLCTIEGIVGFGYNSKRVTRSASKHTTSSMMFWYVYRASVLTQTPRGRAALAASVGIVAVCPQPR